MQALWVFDRHLAQTCLMQLSACQAIHRRPKLVHESEIDLSQKWFEYERLNANWDRSKLVWTLHVSKQTEIDQYWWIGAGCLKENTVTNYLFHLTLWECFAFRLPKRFNTCHVSTTKILICMLYETILSSATCNLVPFLLSYIYMQISTKII